jgi:hypothetical protein
VRAGLDDYFASNGFDIHAYDAPSFEVDLAEVTGEVWEFPNTPTRKRALPLHDLHHVATGYGTDVLGEAEIGAWELVAGCNSLFLWWINLSAIGLGLLLNPWRTVRAAARALGHRTLYRDPLPYPALLELTVGELRARLKMSPKGQADHPARLHRRAPEERTEPQFSLPGPLRKALRLLSAGINPALGGVRVPSH